MAVYRFAFWVSNCFSEMVFCFLKNLELKKTFFSKKVTTFIVTRRFSIIGVMLVVNLWSWLILMPMGRFKIVHLIWWFKCLFIDKVFSINIVFENFKKNAGSSRVRLWSNFFQITTCFKSKGRPWLKVLIYSLICILASYPRQHF